MVSFVLNKLFQIQLIHLVKNLNSLVSLYILVTKTYIFQISMKFVVNENCRELLQRNQAPELIPRVAKHVFFIYLYVSSQKWILVRTQKYPCGIIKAITPNPIIWKSFSLIILILEVMYLYYIFTQLFPSMSPWTPERKIWGKMRFIIGFLRPWRRLPKNRRPCLSGERWWRRKISLTILTFEAMSIYFYFSSKDQYLSCVNIFTYLIGLLF